MRVPLENVYRRPYEIVPAATALAAAITVKTWPELFMLPAQAALATSAALAGLSALRAHQAKRIIRYRNQLRQLPHYALEPKDVPSSAESLFLGKGFEWTQKHTQRLHQARKPGNEHLLKVGRMYKWARDYERNHPDGDFITNLTRKGAWWNPASPMAPVGGKPEIHGVEPDEEDAWTALAELTNHVIVYGTTRVGKTRFAQLLIGQDIRRGDPTFVFDPKGDVELLLSMYAEAVRAGREKDFYVFHLGFPEISARYNPIGTFEQITEVASRTTGPLPEEGQSAAFKAFAWRYVNSIARTMSAVGEKPDLAKIYTYGVNIDKLAKAYFETWLDQHDPRWRDHFDPHPTKEQKDLVAKTERNSRDIEVVLLSRFFRERGHKDQLADSLNGILSNDRTYFEKLVNSLYPLLEKLTTGKLAELISPNYLDPTDPRPLMDWQSLITRDAIVYCGFDALSIPDVAEAVSAAMLSDLTSVAGSIYKHGLGYGLSVKEKSRRIRLHLDEVNELIGPYFKQLANKAGGAGMQITAYTQTGQDIEVKVGSPAAAGQIGGNLNTLVMFRVKNEETATILTSQLDEVSVWSVTPDSAVNDTNDPGDFADFSSRSGDRISAEKVPLITPAMVMQQPKGQAFALLEGGRLMHIRVPLPLPERDLPVPQSWDAMINKMRAQARMLDSHADEAEELTVEGTGGGF